MFFFFGRKMGRERDVGNGVLDLVLAFALGYPLLFQTPQIRDKR